jgi:predicted transcriptional regulator
MARKRKMNGPPTSDLTIRLSPDERERLEKLAEAEFLPVSTWLRQLALKAAVVADEERAREGRRKEWLAAMREELWKLPPAHEHADEVERARKRDWGRR